MKGNSSKGNPFIVAISQKLRNIGSGRLSAIRGKINTNRTLDKVEKRLARWVKEGRHHECDNSMEEILDELGLTNGELSFYCSHVLNKKFLTWRKEMRIEDAKNFLWSSRRLLCVISATSLGSAINPTSGGSSGRLWAARPPNGAERISRNMTIPMSERSLR